MLVVVNLDLVKAVEKIITFSLSLFLSIFILSCFLRLVYRCFFVLNFCVSSILLSPSIFRRRHLQLCCVYFSDTVSCLSSLVQTLAT